MNAIVRNDPYTPSNMAEAEQLSIRLAQSALLPDGLRGKPGDVLVTLITGHELGLSPMQAIRGLHVVRGRAVMSADLAVALTKRHPSCRYFRVVSTDDKAATYETLREGDPEPTRMTFTAEQAKQAGLGGDNWRKYPAAMLRARCSLALARAVYSDIMLGVYDPDELGVPAPAPTPMMEERTVAPPPPVVVVPASCTFAMFGWSISASAWRSASNRATTCLVSIPSLMIFSATRRTTGFSCSAMNRSWCL